MYQALYRKYRPSNFDEVVGQKIVVSTLKNAIVNNKTTHAYLFTGPRGTGKTSIAKIFAKTINCENSNNGIPCETCVSCTQINNKKNTDIIEIDAASNNGVDEIRELKSKVALVPNISKYKIYIIDEVHMLTTGAFNALLKTLEEPPSHVIFILATTEPQKIPSTILSRCQRYDFKKISNDDIFKRLKYISIEEKINISDAALFEIARISDGGLRDAIGILDQVISYKQDNIDINDVHMINGTISQDDLKIFINYLLDNKIEKVFDILDQYYNNGKNIQKITDEIIYFLRNLLLYKITPNYLEKNGIDISIYDNININNCNVIINLINNFNDLTNKLKQSSNQKIIFEMNIINSINISREIFTKENENNIKEENKIIDNKIQIKEVKDINIDNSLNDFKNIRINNVLSRLNKKIIKTFNEEKVVLNNLLLDNEISKYVSLLLDGEVKAASDEGIIYVYEYDSDSVAFNNNIEILENIIIKYLNKNIKLVSVSKNEWEQIKNDFNSKNKKYIYIEEKNIKNKKEQKSINISNKNSMEKIFDDLVEYTKEEL